MKKVTDNFKNSVTKKKEAIASLNYYLILNNYIIF